MLLKTRLGCRRTAGLLVGVVQALVLLAIVPAAQAQFMRTIDPGASALTPDQAGVALQTAVRDFMQSADTTGTITLRTPNAGFEYRLNTTDFDPAPGATTSAGRLTATWSIRTVTIAGVPTTKRLEVIGTPTGSPRVRIVRVDSDTVPRFRFFNVELDGQLILSDLEFEFGSANEGGALRISQGQLLQATRCRIVNNLATSSGGGVHASEAARAIEINNGDETQGLQLFNCEIIRNRVTNADSQALGGGGVFAANSRMRIFGGVISCNTVTGLSGSGGGVFYARGDSAPFTFQIRPDPATPSVRPIISCNTARLGGGAFVSSASHRYSDQFAGTSRDQLPLEFEMYSNAANEAGGGLYVTSSALDFVNCQIGASGTRTCEGCTPADVRAAGNRAPQGGGMYCTNSRSRVIRCKFEFNQADGSGGFPGNGAGAMCLGRVSVFEECCFTGNVAASTGGGAYMQNKSSPLFDDCVFRDNVAQRGGGIGFFSRADGWVYNTVLTHNVGTVEGGGVWIQDASVNILHATIARNLSAVGSTAASGPATAGTGIHIAFTTSSGVTDSAAVDVLNSIVYGNRGNGVLNGSFSFSGNAGRVATFGVDGLTLANSFAGNITPAGADRAFPRVRFSDVQRTIGPAPNSFAIWPSPADDADGPSALSNINSDPRFANLDSGFPGTATYGNVHLTCPSPAIDRASYQRARQKIRALVDLTDGPILVFDPDDGGTDPDEATIQRFIDEFQDDYDDAAGDMEEFESIFRRGNEICQAANCPIQPYPGAEPVQPRTCRAVQCQSDMGADESKNGILIDPLPDKVVCVNGRQSFTVNPRCENPGSACDPNTTAPQFTITWCRVRFDLTRPAGQQCLAEEPLSNGNGITITPDGRTITIDLATRTDDLNFNSYIRAKITRAGPGLFVPLPAAAMPPQPCEGACPPVCAQARLYVVPAPAVSTTGDKTVCRAGSQCLEYSFSWTILPTTVQPVLCPCPGDPNPEAKLPPVACNPQISYTYQQALTGTGSVPVTFTGRPPRVTIVCEPDTSVPDAAVGPFAPGSIRVTRVCRIKFTNAQDDVPTTDDCDAGRYCAKLACNIIDPISGQVDLNKCPEAMACANLCVTPPPTAGGDTNQVVCVTGNQTINLFAEFPPPAGCAIPWCTGTPCTPSVSIIKRFPPSTPPIPDQTLTIGQTGRVAVTCDPPTGVNRRINCRVVITGAQPGDCAQYCIIGDCNNLSDTAPCGGMTVDKCGEALWCANLCVLPPLVAGGDATKKVCLGGTQTITLYVDHPLSDCFYCLPTSCTPATPTVKRILPNGTTITLGASRTDAVTGQPTSTTTLTCGPDPVIARRQVCTVRITNANDTNCAQYKIEGGCSNLTAVDKCYAMYTTQLCVGRQPTVTPDVNKYVCFEGTQTITLKACFPASPCIYCTPEFCVPRVRVVRRPITGTDVPLLTAGPTGGSAIVGHASVVCDPVAAGTAQFCPGGRTIECRVTVAGANLEDCGRYCLQADYSDITADKCPPVEGCTPLCVVPRPVTTGDPDKTVCFGKSQTLNFKATFPLGTCAVTTDCPTACTPSVVMIKKLQNNTEVPLVSGAGTTVTCDPVSTLPNGDREINCRVVVTNADQDDCANYCIRANCGNLAGGTKCREVEYCTKLCVIRNPTVTIEPSKFVCIGGNQSFGITVTFPPQDCIFCPPTACTGAFEIVKRTNCSTTTGGTIIPINPVTPPTAGAYATCSPVTPGSPNQNCTLFVRNATDADCSAYFIRAISCPLLPSDKCMYVEACGTLCVIPPSQASGDPKKYVCVGGNQTINLRGFFPNATCLLCPTTPSSYCTPRVTLVRRLPDGTVQDIPYAGGPVTGPAVPRVTATCGPVTTVGGANPGREVLCTVTVTGAQPGDCANYCIQTTCGNLAQGKCGTAEYCTPLCVFPPPTTGGDPNSSPKLVCVKGTQFIDLYAAFPAGDCIHCDDAACTRAFEIKRIGPTGTETVLNIGGSRTDVITYPSLPPDPPTGPETVTSTTSVVCQPFDPVTRRVNCRVTVTNANDANCGRYCITARCGNFPLTGAGSDKCTPSTYCVPLCIMRPPTATAERTEACVCVGGCQTLRFTATFPLPNCNLPGCDGNSCTPLIRFYKVLANGTRVELAAGANVEQFTCGPLTANRTKECTVKVGGGSDGPGVDGGAGGGGPCPGARLDEDNKQYCMEVTCGGLAEGKCLTDSACTRLRVYEKPCPTPIPDIKICKRAELCIPFNYVAPPCCQPVVTVVKDGTPLTLSPTGRYRIVTLPAGGYQFCIRAPNGQNLDNGDDGNYQICVECPNLTAEKGCRCCEDFCLDVLTPPEVTATPPELSVCEGQTADFYFCPSGDVMRCPMPGQTVPFPVPLTLVVDRVRRDLTNANECFIPTNPQFDPIGGNATFTAVPDVTCPGRYRLRVTDVHREDCGVYRVRVTYNVPAVTNGIDFDAMEMCTDTVYVCLRCDTVDVCLELPCACPESTVRFCPRFAPCSDHPYVNLPDADFDPAVHCPPCFRFEWWFKPDGGAAFTKILVADNPTAEDCCLVITSAQASDVGEYFVRVIPGRRIPDPASPTGYRCEEGPCLPVNSNPYRFYLCPEQCCWCEECCWDNGRRQEVNGNGVLSMIPAHGEFPELKAAADFYLCEGQFHKIKKFASSMLIRQNPALPYKAKLTLYEDCDGCPGSMIKMWNLTEYCLVGIPDSTGLQKVDFKIEFTTDDKLWLQGGRTYWWSIQGLSDFNTPNYEAYWVTSQLGHVVGSVPKKMEVGVDEDWRPLDECCIDCDELAFCIECEMCKIIYDGGVPEACENAGGTRSEKSVSPTRNSRAADNFVTPPAISSHELGTEACNFIVPVDWMVCYVEGYVYTNCNSQTFKSYLEIYQNECDEPDYDLTGNPVYRFRADKIDPVVPECLATIDGVSGLRLYKVRFCPMVTLEYPHGLYLSGGKNYWASISVEDTFNQNQRAYWAWNSDDCSPCPIQFGEGLTIAPGRNINRWTKVGHDFAFLIAARVPTEAGLPPPPITTTPVCPPDTNRDGTVTVQDMFDFLAAWFAGCP